MNYTLNIGWLYPQLMNTYGDQGNIICLKKRCEWRNIEVKIKSLDVGFSIGELKRCDLLFMGGAQDRQQKIVMQDLKGKKAEGLKEMVEEGIPGLYICGAYQFLGKYYKEADSTIINGLGILDLYTENPGLNHKRLIGNIIAQSSIFSRQGRDQFSMNTLVGFENHGGRTYLGKNIKPFGKVIKGFGNNGNQPSEASAKDGDKTEGAIYKNSVGTYLHGPILPKNPHLADYLIKIALEKKYKIEIQLKPLDDNLEWQAHQAVAKKIKF